MNKFYLYRLFTHFKKSICFLLITE